MAQLQSDSGIMDKIYGFVPIAIAEGRTADFVAGARLCHEAALPDLAGTLAYEWYLSDDGRQAYVIEVYDDPAAVAHHSRMMDGRVARLREMARFRILFAGDVPDALQERMRGVLGDVSHAGPRAFGRLDGPTPHRTPPPGDDLVFALAWFRPRSGQSEPLRALARESFERACANDPGTRAYEWFFDADGNCVALDLYESPDAMLAHMANCAPVMQRILEVADSRTIIFGELPASIAQRPRPELGITRFRQRLHGVA